MQGNNIQSATTESFLLDFVLVKFDMRKIIFVEKIAVFQRIFPIQTLR